MKTEVMIRRLNTELMHAKETERDYELDRNHYYELLKKALAEYENGYRCPDVACDRIEQFAHEMANSERKRTDAHMQVEMLNWIAMKGRTEK